ncbi:aspartyl-phosphate phosphatase Spo0E family protein [Paenibacillus sp. R14(2021)]|nr:aspartyl-phosphate phosphatase Spo0E family protein [Paenibacillus sp. R14(2021)]
MVDSAVTYGSLTHERVVIVSQKLDRYILAFQKLKRRKQRAM